MTVDKFSDKNKKLSHGLSKIHCFQIGFQKCGTTFFEKSLYSSNPEIRFVQASGKPELEDLLFKKFIYPDRLEYDRQEFERAFAGVAAKFFPDTPEKINGLMFEPFTFVYERRFDRKNVLCRIRESFADTKVIMLIRSQESWIYSHYSNYIRGGGVLSFYDFIETFLNDPVLDSFSIDWYPLISSLFDIFGREKVLVVLQEELRDSPQDVANRVFDFLGASRVKVNPGVVNPSLGRLGLPLCRLLNHVFSFDYGASSYGYFRALKNSRPGTWQKIRHLFIYRFWKIAISKIAYMVDSCYKKEPFLILTKYQRLKFYERYYANNRKLAELLEVDLSKYRYPIDLPDI